MTTTKWKPVAFVMRLGRYRLYVDRSHVSTMTAVAREYGEEPLRDQQPRLVTWRYSISDMADGNQVVREDEGFRTGEYAQAAALAQFDGKRLRAERDDFLGTAPAPAAANGPSGGGETTGEGGEGTPDGAA